MSEYWKKGYRGAVIGLGLASTLLGGVVLGGAQVEASEATNLSKAAGSQGEVRGLESIRPSLKHPNALVRLGAVKGLAFVLDPGKYLELANLARDKDPRVRLAAVEVLAADEGELAVGALAPYLRDRDPTIRSLALSVIGGEETQTAVIYLGEISTHPDASLRGQAIGLLAAQARGEEGHAVAEALLGYLADPLPSHRVAAVEALGKTGDPILIEQVAGLYTSPDWTLRLAAVDTLRRTWDREGADALLSFVGDEVPAVRSRAYMGLARMGGAASFEALVEEGLEDPSWDVRLEVASLAADLRLKEAVPGMVRSVQEAEMELKRPFLEELHRMGTVDSKAALIGLNQEGSPFERLLVAKIVSEGREELRQDEALMWQRMTGTELQDGDIRINVSFDPAYGYREP